MLLLAVVPVIFFTVMWRWLLLRGFEAREALLVAGVINGLLIVFSTEALSCFRLVSFVPVLFFWVLAAAALSAAAGRVPGFLRWNLPAISLTVFEKILLGMALLIVSFVGFIALCSPPNTFDSMTYHMARVAHWQQDKGVMNYPTNIIRQLVYPPYAEYVILQLQVLSGSDRLANMVQWMAMVLSATGASLIARALGAVRSGQIIAALLVLTLPMGIMQGSSTQNDYVAASQVICAAYFIVKFSLDIRFRWILAAAASVGLAVFTKGTGFLFCSSFLLMGVFLSRVDIRRKAVLLAFCVAAVFMIAGPFYCRLTAIDKDPISLILRTNNSSVQAPGPVETASNVLRNAGTQLALPWQGWNAAVEGVILLAHRTMGIDIVEPRTTQRGPYRLWYYLDEDYMPNPLHMLFVLAMGVLFWFVRGKERQFWLYALSLALGVLVFCVETTWNQFISRYHLVMFVLAMPLGVVVFERTMPRKVLTGIALVMFVAAMQPLLMNNTRQVLSGKSLLRSSRAESYFAKHVWEYSLVSRVSAMVSQWGCRDVGLVQGSDDWEYSWQVFLGRKVRVEQMKVEGPAAGLAYPNGDFAPCVIVDTVAASRNKVETFNNSPFVKVGEGNDFVLYVNAGFAQRMSGRL